MTAAELLHTRLPHGSLRLWLLAIGVALIAAVLLDGSAPVETPTVAAPPVAMLDNSSGARIDHSVLADPALAAEPDPGPAAVAAYGD